MFKSVPLSFFLFLLLAIPISLLGNSFGWTLVKRNTDALYYIDQRSVRKLENKFVVKTFARLKSTIFDSASFLFTQKVDCESNESKIISYLSFPDNNILHENTFQRYRKSLLPNFVFSTEYTQELCKHILR